MKVVNLYPRRWPRWVRICLRILVGILLVLLLLLALIQSEWGQRYITRQVKNTLRKQFDTRVELARISLNGFNQIGIRGLTVFDRDQKILLHSDSLSVRFALWPLLSREIKVYAVSWKKLVVQIYTRPDNSLNYQFLLDAMAGSAPESAPPETEKEAASPWTISIGRVQLDNINLLYNDVPAGMNAALKLNSLTARFRETDLAKGLFDLNEFTINGLTGFFDQAYRAKTTPAITKETNPADSGGLDIRSKLVRLENVHFFYGDEGSGIKTGWQLGSGKIELLQADLLHNRFTSGPLSMDGPRGYLLSKKGLDTLEKVVTESSPPLKVQVQSLLIKNAAYGMQQLDAPRSRYKKSIDFNYLGIQLPQTSLTAIRWEDDSLQAELKSLEVRERSGFHLRKASGAIRYNPTHIAFTNYFLQTEKSQLANSLEILLPTDSAGNIQTERIGINASFPKATLTLAEALYFAPELKADTALSKIWDKQLFLSGRLSGSLQALLLQQFSLRDNVGNVINLRGTLRHLTNSKLMGADLQQLELISGKKSIIAWLPAGLLPSNVELAEKIRLNGRLSGNMQRFNTRLRLESSFGNLQADAQVANLTNKVSSSYMLQLQELDMDVGKWITDTTIGRINVKGYVKGKGYDPNTMKTDLELLVREAAWNGYTYQDIAVQGQLDKGNYTAMLESKDSNLVAKIDLSGALKDSSLPTIKGRATLDKADLYAVGLSTQPMVVKGLFDIDVSSTAPRNLVGEVLVHNVQYADGKEQYQLDSISILAGTEGQDQFIRLESPFGKASLTGDYDYIKLASTVSGLIAHHIEQDYEQKKRFTDSSGRQYAVLDASLIIPKNLEKLLPDLEMTKPLLLKGRINTDSSLVYFSAAQPQFRYGTAVVDSTKLLVYLDQDSLQFRAAVDGVEHPSFSLNQTSFSGSGSDGKLQWQLKAADKEGKNGYDVGGQFVIKSKNEFSISLNPSLLLNKTAFTTNEDNEVIIKDGSLYDASLEIGSGSQSIQLKHSKQDSLQANTYYLTIKDFQGSTISSFISKDTSLANGLINASLQYSSKGTDTNLTGDLTIDSLEVFGKPVGALEAHFNTAGKAIGIEARLKENGNNVLIKGTYGETLEARITMDSLQLASIEPFTFGSLTNMGGAIQGDLTVTGALTDPALEGKLNFHKGKFRVSYLNNPLLLDQQTISFSDKSVLLNNFSLQDTAGGKAVFDGRVKLTDLQNPGFDLKLNANNFLVLGPKSKEDQMIWGPARINTQTTIGGNLNLPKVDMQLKLMDKSAIGFVVPEDEPGIVNREGVIVFVNRQQPLDSSLLKQEKSGSVQAAGFSGIDFSANVEITPASTLTIVIDPYNGDFLEVKGNTNLQVDIDQGNNISLSGAYEISEGKYEMSLSQLIKRSFQIEKGSTIVWNGDPLEAAINITAKNEVMAPAIDLIRDQSSVSRSELNMAKQKVPVEVFMDITGKLMAPTIQFRLDMPEKDRNMFNGAVYTRLKQINTIESELTKQVMSLLVLQTFMSENPLASLENRSEGGLGFTAKQSVSKILSQQLNTLAGSLISGIDLNFDLQTREDYMSGSREESTVLNVGASKSLFNDRLTVSVGSNIGLIGEQPQNNAHLIGDVLIDYKISRDGRYRLRAYQRNQTDAILLGQIIETGVSFILVMDFDQFREIFHRAKKNQQGGQP